MTFNIDNYDKEQKERVPYEHYKEEFKNLDPKEAAARTGAAFDEEKSEFTVTLMSEKLTVSYPEFEVYDEKGEVVPFYNIKILIMRYLLESKVFPKAGRFLDYKELKWGEVYYDNFKGRCLARLAFTFGMNLTGLDKAMAKIGGREIKGGDRGYEFDFLDDIAVRINVYGPDDEFPPSSQITFSDNTIFAFGAEDAAVIGDIFITKLKVLANE